jgi:hypothetical protein
MLNSLKNRWHRLTPDSRWNEGAPDADANEANDSDPSTGLDIANLLNRPVFS